MQRSLSALPHFGRSERAVLGNLAVLLGVGGLYYFTDGFAFFRAQRERVRSLYEALPVQAGDIVFLGDSITAATNVVRPAGAPSCGDAGYQSDWSQSYAALLCQHFGASCSTVAVGGKCMMRECGGLQMPEYFRARMMRGAPA